jgi:Icc-related predicted phosphoesterase
MILENILAISDSHGRWKTWEQDYQDYSAEILIMAGDMFGEESVSGQRKEFEDMMIKFRHHFPNVTDWILVPGNHDFLIERGELSGREIKVLVDSGIDLLTSDGFLLKIWGNPWTCCGSSWAYQLHTRYRQDLKKIPAGLDILVTHDAPRLYELDCIKNSIGDYGEEEPGNLELAEEVKKKKPKVHIFGHIHKSCSLIDYCGTSYYNVSGYYPVKIKIEKDYD